MTDTSPLAEPRRKAKRLAQSEAFEWLAGAGLIARGAVYCLMGALALGLALGIGGKTTSQTGALKTIGEQPLGKVILILVAAGLASYSLWRLIRAVLGHGKDRDDSPMERLAGLVSGIAYGALAVTAVTIIAGSSSSQGASQTTGGVLAWTGGTLIVAAVGLIIMGVGAEQIYRGLTAKFLEDVKRREADDHAEHLLKVTGVFGFAARGVVFGLVGFFLLKAAIDFNPQAAVTVDGALSKVANASYGPVLLAAVAAGLVAFGVFSITQARYGKA
jgi:hypothetical protein